MLHEVTDHPWRSTQEQDWTVMLAFSMACRHLLHCMCQIDLMHSPVVHILVMLI